MLESIESSANTPDKKMADFSIPCAFEKRYRVGELARI